jgi:UDP-glucose-4-epimerase GalE
VLVTGGAGYIGSHLVRRLESEGYGVSVLDVVGDGTNLADAKIATARIGRERYDVVVHLAGAVGPRESVREPERFYRDNVLGTLNLLSAMEAGGIDRIVYSSSSAVYGNPVRELMDEEHPTSPVNPYGWTKLMAERAIRDYATTGLRSISFRYFNVAGCDPELRYAENETFLIPRAVREALRVHQGGRLEATSLRVYGRDYDTPDGTCVRDYVHVEDICRAHIAGVHRILQATSPTDEVYNLGCGRGFSVLEVIEAVRRVTGYPIRYESGPRMSGDPPRLVSDWRNASRRLGWKPTEAALERSIREYWTRELQRAERTSHAQGLSSI